MIMYTYQISKTPKEFDGLILDVTVKSGDLLFAPSWDMVMAKKSGKLTDEEYTILYVDRMVESYHKNTDHWLDLIRDNYAVAFGCYCRANIFCHRHLLVDIMKDVAHINNLDVMYAREIK